MAELKGNKYGTHRVIEPKGVLTQAAWKIDNDMSKVYSNEIVCDVTSLNIDSASFTQISEACGGDEKKIGEMILGIVAERGKQQERVKLPMWLNITLIVLFAAIAVTLILRFTVYKENQLMNYISSLLLGVTCLVLFYTRRFKHTKKDSTFYTLVTVLLTVMGIVYTAMGLIGILTMFGII